MMLSTIPATVAGFTKLCDWLRAEISIIRTKKVGTWPNCTCFPYTSIFANFRARAHQILNGEATMTTQVAGYTYGTNDVARSPLTLEDLNLLKQTVLFTEDDEKYLSWRSVGRPNWWFWIRGIPLLVLTSSGAILQHSRQSINWRVLLLFVNDFINGFWTPVTVLMTKPGSTINKKLVYGIPMLRKIKPTMLPLCRILDCDTWLHLSHYCYNQAFG